LQVDLLVDAGRSCAAAGAFGHALDVAARAEGAAGSGENDAADLGIDLASLERRGHRR
jgi:hypothetical protein